MSTTTNALVKTAADQPYKVDAIEIPALQGNQVTIDVKFCGVCHSDLAMGENHWGMTTFPFVGGHEIAGVISEVGEQVTHLKVGDRVGAGWFSGSCRSCEQCIQGKLNLCPTQERTIIGRHGGFANKVRVNNEWCAKLPDAMALEDAGPLLCAGITVFAPLLETPVLPTQTVGVIGIGGLGHLAIQFAAKWGCKVVCFTTSEDKATLAKELGATDTADAKDENDIKKFASSIDLLLMCGTGDLNWDLYFSTLAPQGKFHFCGVPASPIAVNIFPMLVNEYSLTSKPSGSPAALSKMLDFAARHGIKPVSEEFKFSQVVEAFDHLKDGKARFRIVLKNDLEQDQ